MKVSNQMSNEVSHEIENEKHNPKKYIYIHIYDENMIINKKMRYALTRDS